MSPDDRRVVTGGGDSQLLLWDILSGEAKGKLLADGLKGAINCCAFTPDGAAVVAAGADGRARFWVPALSDGDFHHGSPHVTPEMQMRSMQPFDEVGEGETGSELRVEAGPEALVRQAVSGGYEAGKFYSRSVRRVS